MTGPIVIKVGGTTLEDQRSAPALWRAIASLHATHPTGIILVHGGGKAVDRHLDRLGFTTQRRDGIRITPADQLDEITGVLAGRINKALVGSLLAAGARAVGLCLGDGNAVPTRKATRYPFDPGQVGEVSLPLTDASEGRGAGSSAPKPRSSSSLPPNLLTHLLASKFLPVLSSIGIDAAGEFLNINADDAAAGVAGMLGAEALVLLTDVPGILDATKTLVREATPQRIESMISSGEIHGGMIPKVRAALEAATSTGTPVVILSGNDPAALAEWAAGKPVGTRIVPNTQQPASANAR